jgi:hypothetical protein
MKARFGVEFSNFGFRISDFPIATEVTEKSAYQPEAQARANLGTKEDCVSDSLKLTVSPLLCGLGDLGGSLTVGLSRPSPSG